MVKQEGPPSGSKTLDKGLRILEALAAHPSGLTVSRLAEEVEAHRTIVYRLLLTLAGHGLIARQADGVYRLGLALISLASGVRADLRQAAHQPLATLADRTGATAHLTLPDDDEAVSAVVTEPTRARAHVAYRVGSRHPLDRGAAGMALLLQRPVCSGERVELAGVRDKGYAVSLGELQAGAWGLAAPVRDAEGRVIASVGVIALSELPETSTAAAVQEASQQISRALGALPTT